MGDNNFNGRQCVRALIKLGFECDTRRNGKHDKYRAPFIGANPPFIMVPRHKRIHCQDEIIKELRRMGGDELAEKFRDNL